MRYLYEVINPIEYKIIFIILILLTVMSCTSSEETIPLGNYKSVEAFPNLTFTRPVDLQHAGDMTNRIFVVEQRGVITVFNNEPSVTAKTTFLDIEGQVDDSDNEEGLLGLAFHPQYEVNGYFFLNYTASDPDRTVVSRFSVSADDSNAADPTSEVVILEFSQPYSNHNGGQIAFGPDGFLYIAAGDGGSGGDPLGHGQNRSTLLGSIIRIDVDKQAGANQYAIPSDNPFVGNVNGFKEEIFAYGLRNPWRFSFDFANGRLWAADVGQGDYEEIDLIEKGKNYGWSIMEGSHCYPPLSNCDKSGLTLPVVDYDHSLGRSITGGYVYRGKTHKGLVGKYIYGDYITGRIWALDYSNPSSPKDTLLFESGLNIASFGQDELYELYFCAFDGKIYKFVEE